MYTDRKGKTKSKAGSITKDVGYSNPRKYLHIHGKKMDSQNLPQSQNKLFWFNNIFVNDQTI